MIIISRDANKQILRDWLTSIEYGLLRVQFDHDLYNNVKLTYEYNSKK